VLHLFSRSYLSIDPAGVSCNAEFTQLTQADYKPLTMKEHSERQPGTSLNDVYITGVIYI
jgi:hypothetical protein